MSGFDIITDVLVVGAGPAGASAALFLAQNGVSALAISRFPGTAESPRAHITNQRTMEVLRDAGLEGECMAEASPSEDIEHTFWLRSMAGEELARVYTWGNDPARLSEYALGSPSRMCDLPQTRLEPILVEGARRSGAEVRFNLELKHFTQDEDGVTAFLQDRAGGASITVRSRYLLGADGARSRVVEQLGIPLIGEHGLGGAINVHCELDLTEAVKHRHGSLYGVIAADTCPWAPVAVFRMVKPWNEWLVALMAPPGPDPEMPSQAEIEARVLQLTGIPGAKIRTISISKWHINDVHAAYYSDGRVFCLGDAVHRHPPTGGLGSNTCVQDAFNLAWKLALVLKGKAGPGLLDSFNTERQPVGQQIVARANKSMAHNQKIWMALAQSMDAPYDPETEAAMRQDIEEMYFEYHAHGMEMNRAYDSGAVIADGSELVYARDSTQFYQRSTRPGSMVPHVWLARRSDSARFSTLDIAGKQRFVLLTGHGGEAWRDAAAKLAQAAGVALETVLIGPRLDYEDVYGAWEKIRDVDSEGCVLVRPDLHVAWRSPHLPAEPGKRLAEVLAQLLDRNDIAAAFANSEKAEKIAAV
jgi:2,4-dichlorophenol 6-monooxygenase